VVLDASVIVKWFVEEIYSDKALKLRDSYIEGKMLIIAPTLLPFEVLNALKYTHLFKEDDLKVVAEALDSYNFELINLKGEYAKKAVEIAINKDITIYESSYVALALIFSTKLYTADSKLIEKLGDDFKEVVIHISRV